jgi:hypothetical protein
LGGPKDQVIAATRAVLDPLGLDVPPVDQLLLVDGRGQIRGRYGMDKESIDHLMQDVGYVVNLP